MKTWPWTAPFFNWKTVSVPSRSWGRNVWQEVYTASTARHLIFFRTNPHDNAPKELRFKSEEKKKTNVRYISIDKSFTFTTRSCQHESLLGVQSNPFTVPASSISGLKSTHIHSFKQHVWRSCNKSLFQYCAFWQKPFYVLMRRERRKALTVSSLAVLVVVFRVTARKAWQWKG